MCLHYKLLTKIEIFNKVLLSNRLLNKAKDNFIQQFLTTKNHNILNLTSENYLQLICDYKLYYKH